MAVFLCIPCALGDCRECRRQVVRGRVTKPCSCRHGDARPAVVRASTDPRDLGGRIISTGDDVLLDTRRALVVDGSEVCKVENPSDGRQLVALFLEGRVARTDERAAVLHLLAADGLAALVSEFVGLAARMGPAFESEFRTALDARLDVADLWPSVPC